MSIITIASFLSDATQIGTTSNKSLKTLNRTTLLGLDYQTQSAMATKARTTKTERPIKAETHRNESWSQAIISTLK